MKAELRTALVHARRTDGAIGGYPTAPESYTPVVQSGQGRPSRFVLSYPQYLVAFRFWSQIQSQGTASREDYQRRYLRGAA